MALHRIKVDEEVEKEKVRLQAEVEEKARLKAEVAEAAKKVSEPSVSRPEGTRSHPIGSGISSVIAALNAEQARKQEAEEARLKAEAQERVKREAEEAELLSNSLPKSMMTKRSLAKSRKNKQLSKENKTGEEAVRLAKEQEIEEARLKAGAEAEEKVKKEVAKFQAIKNKITGLQNLTKDEAEAFASYALAQLKTESILDEDKALIKAFLLKAINPVDGKKTKNTLDDVLVALKLLSDLGGNDVIKESFVVANIEGIIAILSAGVVQEKGLIGILQTLVKVEKNIQAREQIEQVITMLNSNNYGNDAPGKDFKGLMTWGALLSWDSNKPYNFKYWGTDNRPQDANPGNKDGGIVANGLNQKLTAMIKGLNVLRDTWNKFVSDRETSSEVSIADVLAKAKAIEKGKNIDGNLDEFIKHIDLLPKA